MGSLNKIIYHWTAGTNVPNATDLAHYHYLVDASGKVYEGNYKPEDNLSCKDGHYAKHCGGGNTGAIGIAVCGMATVNYPLTHRQLEAACKLGAELSYKYGIPITNKTILTHSEFGNSHPHTTSYGKVDINELPCVCVWGREACGDWIRNKVNWYKSKIGKEC